MLQRWSAADAYKRVEDVHMAHLGLGSVGSVGTSCFKISASDFYEYRIHDVLFLGSCRHQEVLQCLSFHWRRDGQGLLFQSVLLPSRFDVKINAKGF